MKTRSAAKGAVIALLVTLATSCEPSLSTTGTPSSPASSEAPDGTSGPQTAGSSERMGERPRPASPGDGADPPCPVPLRIEGRAAARRGRAESLGPPRDRRRADGGGAAARRPRECRWQGRSHRCVRLGNRDLPRTQLAPSTVAVPRRTVRRRRAAALPRARRQPDRRARGPSDLVRAASGPALDAARQRTPPVGCWLRDTS